MTLSEFNNKYCSLCGSLICSGINDIEEREGCPHYRKVFMNDIQQYKRQTHKSTKNSINTLNIFIQPIYEQLRNEGYTIKEALYIIKTSATLCAVNETTKSSGDTNES